MKKPDLPMYLIFAEASVNIMEAVRNLTGKEPERMKRFQTGLIRKFKNMKYRHKLTILLVVASLVPMVILAWYSHIRISSMSRRNAVEDMNSMLEQTREGIDSQIEVYSSLLN